MVSRQVWLSLVCVVTDAGQFLADSFQRVKRFFIAVKIISNTVKIDFIVVKSRSIVVNRIFVRLEIFFIAVKSVSIAIKTISNAIKTYSIVVKIIFIVMNRCFTVVKPLSIVSKTAATVWQKAIYAETTAHQPIFPIKPPFNSSCPPPGKTEQIICRNVEGRI